MNYIAHSTNTCIKSLVKQQAICYVWPGHATLNCWNKFFDIWKEQYCHTNLINFYLSEKSHCSS
jgi:hypothetical protein